jgi:uncharacterized protein YxeA
MLTAIILIVALAIFIGAFLLIFGGMTAGAVESLTDKEKSKERVRKISKEMGAKTAAYTVRKMKKQGKL